MGPRLEDKLLAQGKQFEKKRRYWKRWQKVVSALACVVVFCTTYALILPAITMEGATYCGQEEHKHTEECYTAELVCGQEESAGHTHTDKCRQIETVLVCTTPESEGHTHSESCYNEAGEQICGKEESEGHRHTDACYETKITYICGEEESEGHTHTDACYETKNVLICGKEEHEHTLSCYSNTNADLETTAVWEKTLPDKLSGVWADDVLEVAKSQLGYKESTANYQVEEDGTTKKGYTRYGAWYGVPYGDWCAMFVSFCINYADIPESDVPLDCSCRNWVDTLAEQGMYHEVTSDYQPEPGDIIFFSVKKNGVSDHVGLVAEVTENKIKTIEGNSNDQVEYNTYGITDGRILGYGELPENPQTNLLQNGAMLLDDDIEESTQAAEQVTEKLPVTSLTGADVTYDKEADNFKSEVKLTFEFAEDATITAGTVYIYTYPKGVVLPEGELNQAKVLMDGTKNAGTYEFVKNEDGTYSVQIVFNEDYVEKYCNKGKEVTGYVNFEGRFTKDSVKEDGSIQIGGSDLVINVPSEEIKYPEDETESYNISTTKEGQWVKKDNQLIYTVYVRTTKGTPGSINFTDTMTNLDSLQLGTPTVTVEKGTAEYHSNWSYDNTPLTTVSGVTSAYDSTTHQLTMSLPKLEQIESTPEYDKAEFYKITYTYPITDDSWSGEVKPNNTVSVESTDSKKSQTVKTEDSKEVYLSKDTSHTLEKYGEESGSQIKWTITVNKNQVDIAGGKISDDMLKLAEGKVEVTPSDGYTYDKDAGTITFDPVSGEQNTNQYTIVYYTPIGEDKTAGEKITNQAHFDPTPEEDNGDEKNVEYTVTVTDTKLNKYGSYDQNSGKINWTIDINSNGKDIAGTTLTDTLFNDLQTGDIKIEPSDGYEIVTGSDGKITEIRFKAVGETEENNQHYKITYATVPVTENPGVETKISNTANLNPGEGGTGPGITTEVTVPPVTVTKSGYYANNLINWTVTVNAGRRDITGYELTDTKFSGLKPGDISIRYSSYSSSNDVPTSEYEIKTDNDGNVTGIVFKAVEGSATNTNQYFLSYNTPAVPEWNSREEKNEVHLKKDEVNIEASSTVTVPGVKKASKSGGAVTPSEDGKTGTIEWTVTVDVPPTGLPEGVTITDDVTKNQSGNANNRQWISWDEINMNPFRIEWRDADGNYISSSNPYDDNNNPQFVVKFLASDGKEYDYKTIREGGNYYQSMTYTLLTLTFPNGLECPEPNKVPTQITFSYSTTVDLENSDVGTNHFYNSVDVDGEKADSYVNYEKSGVVKTDGDGNKGTSTTSSDGELVWKVKAKTVGKDIKKLTVTDTLPKGVLPKTIYVEGSGMANVHLEVGEDNTITGEGYPYQYKGSFNPETGEVVLAVTNQTDNSPLLENQEWNFTFHCEADDTILPVEDTHTLTNTVTVKTDDKELGSDSQTQEWTHTKSTEESKVVQKGGEWDNTNKMLNYSIVLNPEGKDIVEGIDTLTLIDVLKYQSTNIGADWYEGTDGATFTVKADLIQNSVRLYHAVWDTEKGAWVKSEEITDFSWVYKTEKSEYWGETVTSTLTVKGIPDGYPLIFEYAYSVSSDAEDHVNPEKIKFNLPFSNEAKLEGSNHSDSSSSTMEQWSHSSSSAGVTTEYHTYTFYKVAKDNYNKALPGAVFSVYEYSKTEGRWLPDPIHTYTTDEEGKLIVTFEDKNEKGEKLYKYNTVYGISETTAPEGYLIPKENNAWYFYFSNAEEENNMPDTIQSGAIDLSVEAETVYVENVSNKAEIAVEKKWQDSNGNPVERTSGSVKIQLYQKTSQGSSSGGGTGGESGGTGVNYSATCNNGATKTGTFENVSVGDRVKISIEYTWAAGDNETMQQTVRGENWSGVADGAGVWTTDTYNYTCTLTSDSLQLSTGDNKDSVKSITCELIEKGDAGSIADPEPSVEEDTPYGDPIELNPGNSWKHIFTNLPQTGTDTDGNAVTYYYYVKEDPLTNYTTSYGNNDGIQSGTITVTNKATDTPVFELPETGGSGKRRYIMGGILLMLASVLLYIKIHLKEGRKRHI